MSARSRAAPDRAFAALISSTSGALIFRKCSSKYDARTLELIDPLIDLAPIDKTPSTADLLEEGTPPSSPAPVVVSSPVVRNRAGSA